MPNTTTGDVLDILQAQHQQVKALLARVANGTGQPLVDDFCELRRMIAVHETAEEEIVYPVIRSAGADGERIAKARTDEEAEGVKVLSKLEGLEPGSAEFTTLFTEFHKAVLDHATAEENEMFPLLRTTADETRRKAMGKAFEAAESVAPTHAHPHTGTSATAQVVTGPALAIMDRVRDALRK